MAVSDAPTRELGRVDTPTASGTPWLVDPVEYVPDLTFPTSVSTYARMRRDPTVRSVLTAYTLPILRAPWHVDPRGASATITRLVADSLGLPVLGDDPVEGPVATRWVKWGDHLRMALRDLVFGFMPFEPVYDVSSGAAFLAGLPERMPWSVTEIDVDDRGGLAGIRQERAGARDVVIPADRLLYYVNDREGATWTGTSLLREAFAPWLFKTDALRGQSRTLRRFGTAVPVMEPIPGFNPTPAQHVEAQRLAETFRGDSERAGAATPGYRLRLVGVEGNVPDHLPWLRYLDEQIARATLTSVLDLGNTDNGSRALGSVFLELLVQAMQAVAEGHADTASVLARRLTDFNEGPDAQAPLIVVGDVGSSRQTLARTVADLVQAGALVMDTALEGWVRDAFDLPASTGPPPATPPSLAGPGDIPGNNVPGNVTAAQGSPSRAGVVTQEGWPYRRPLTAIEAAAGLDPPALDMALETLVARFVAAWPQLAATQQEAVVAEVEAAAAAGDLTRLVGWVPPYGDTAAAFTDAALDAWDAGVQAARGEARAQGVRIPDPGPPDQTALEGVADVAAGTMAASLAAGAAREAYRLGGDGRTTATDVAAGVAVYMAALSAVFPRDVATGVLGDGINGGRAAVMAAAPVPARYYASEVRDTNTCQPCLDVDGRQYASLEEAEAAYPTGGYTDCQGGLRCRGVIFAAYDDGGTG